MFYSSIALNNKAAAFYNDPDLLHKRLWMCYPTTRQIENDPSNVAAFVEHHFGHQTKRTQTSNFLYAIHPASTGFTVVMQSATKPNLSDAFDSIPEMVISTQTKYVELDFKEEQRLNYLIRFNPVDFNRHLSPTIPLLKERTKKACVLNTTHIKTNRVVRIYKKFTKQNENPDTSDFFAVNQVDVFGTLTVKNVQEFTNMVISGIGRGKAYGCGLMLVKNLF